MTHREPDPEPAETLVKEQVPKQSLASKLFVDKNLPHWGMLVVAIMYIGFNMAVGVSGVPPAISLGFSATLGLWYNYLTRQRANGKDGGS